MWNNAEAALDSRGSGTYETGLVCAVVVDSLGPSPSYFLAAEMVIAKSIAKHF